MPSQTPQTPPVLPPAETPSTSREAAPSHRHWGRALAILLLGWAGIALTIAFVHGLIARPTGLVLMGVMLAAGWACVTLLDSVMSGGEPPEHP